MSNKPQAGRIFVVSGASGTGKTTLCRDLEREMNLFFSVSATTRAPRAGENEGRDYRFLSRTEFDKMLENDQFLEWAEVHGQSYGTPREPIESRLKEGHDVLLDLDTQGAIQLKSRPDLLARAPARAKGLRGHGQGRDHRLGRHGPGAGRPTLSEI